MRQAYRQPIRKLHEPPVDGEWLMSWIAAVIDLPGFVYFRGEGVVEEAVIGPKRLGLMAMRRAYQEWHVRGRFPGSRCGRTVKSEIHLLTMLTVKQRRERLKHHVAMHFSWRLRGQYIPPLLFEH